MPLLLTLPIIIYLRGGGSISKPYGNFSCFSRSQTSLQQIQEPEIVKSPGYCPDGYVRILRLYEDPNSNNNIGIMTNVWTGGPSNVIISKSDYCSKNSPQMIKHNWTGPEDEYGYENHPGIPFDVFFHRFNKRIMGIKKAQQNMLGGCPDNYKPDQLWLSPGHITAKVFCVKDKAKIRQIYDAMYGNN